MTTPLEEYWLEHEEELNRYRHALARVCEVLAKGQDDTAALVSAFDREPDLTNHAPLVDPRRVDLDALEQALEEYWRTSLPHVLPPGCVASRYVYQYLPEPLPKRHRAVLDQCFRILLALFGARGTREHGRLQGRVFGYTHALPGVEDLAAHYTAIALAEWNTRSLSSQS